jgi:hypothetical protein
MQKLCSDTFAASRAWKPLIECGRSLLSRKKFSLNPAKQM